MIEDIEKSLNDSFKELFMNNYSWLVILVFVILIILLLYMLIHSVSTSSYRRELETAFRDLKARVEKIENRINTTNSNSTVSSQATLDDIAKQIKELKNEIRK